MACTLDVNSFEISAENDFEESSTSSSICGWLSEDDLEPIATEQEAYEYERQVNREEEEEQKLLERFSGAQDLNAWCKCTKCDLSNITKHDDCSCCQEYDRWREKMEELDDHISCITSHPAFEDVCLNTWVLGVAAIGLRTRKNAMYTTLRQQGRRTESQFFTAVSYRQLMRFLYDYVGNSRRLALPCCVYNKIRERFPEENNSYQGFQQEPERDSTEEEGAEQ